MRFWCLLQKVKSIQKIRQDINWFIFGGSILQISTQLNFYYTKNITMLVLYSSITDYRSCFCIDFQSLGVMHSIQQTNWMYPAGDVNSCSRCRFQYLSTTESQSLRCDLIRFIVGVIHPSDELLSSDIIPRWAVIGWLLTTCTSQVRVSGGRLLGGLSRLRGGVGVRQQGATRLKL